MIIKVAIIGIQGVPAGYGGFESLVENLIGDHCPADVSYTVFCSSVDLPSKPTHYKGAQLKYVPIHANGIHSIAYDIVSMCRAIKGYDIILILGVSGCLFLPVLRKLTKSHIIVNVDGIEHRRQKWGKIARWVLRHSEAMAVKHADIIVADNKGIQDYIADTYHRDAALIAYGGDHVFRQSSPNEQSILSDYKLTSGSYAITVCRIEPENNSHIILEAFSKTDYPLVFIGNWNHSEWSKHLRHTYANIPNLHLLDAIYDLDILYTLRSNAGIYIHGHSAGGTNPSLVEAMHFGIPIATWDVVYNRETTEGRALYFNSAEQLIDLIGQEHLSGDVMRDIARRRYTWKLISEQYHNLFRVK